MRMTSAADLAAEWGLTRDQLLRRRRRYGWPCTRLSRTDIRFTDQQIEQIVAMQSVPPAAPKRRSRTGQSSRSVQRGRA